MYTRRPQLAAGVGRTVFEVCRDSGEVKVAFELPQLLDRQVLGKSWVNQSTWTKSISRGLRTLTCLPGGGYVINDVFGVYQTDLKGNVIRYVSTPDISDLHSAIPNMDNTRLLLANTGCEEILEIDWEGNVLRKTSVSKLFDLRDSPRWSEARAKSADARTMRFDHNRELFHINWAEWLIEDEEMLISCHAPGVIAIVDFRSASGPKITSKWSYFPHCHGPWLDRERGRLLVVVSKIDEVRELCINTGETIWRAPGVGYGKRVVATSEVTAVATDCNGKRLVEFDRLSGRVVWEADIPGLPYSVTAIGE